MNFATGLLVASFAFAPFQEFVREKAAILVTSSRMNQVGHGIVESYYPNALFWHHRELANGVNNSYRAGGYFSLDANHFSATAIEARFKGANEGLTFELSLNDLAANLGGIPSGALHFGANSEQVKVSEIRMGEKLVAEGYRYLFVPVPNAVDTASVSSLKLDSIPTVQQSFLVELGSPESIAAKYQELRKGSEGSAAAGQKAYSLHFDSAPLVFEISESTPAGEDSDAMNSGKAKTTKGWVLTASHQQTTGKILLPVIRPPAASAATEVTPGRVAREIDATHILRSKQEISGFRIALNDYIEHLFSGRTNDTETQYDCILDVDAATKTACRISERKGANGEVIYDRYLDFQLPSPEKSAQDLEKEERNVFYLVAKNARGIPQHFYRVNVLKDSNYVAPRSAQVAPVIDQTVERPTEDLK